MQTLPYSPLIKVVDLPSTAKKKDHKPVVVHIACANIRALIMDPGGIWTLLSTNGGRYSLPEDLATPTLTAWNTSLKVKAALGKAIIGSIPEPIGKFISIDVKTSQEITVWAAYDHLGDIAQNESKASTMWVVTYDNREGYNIREKDAKRLVKGWEMWLKFRDLM